jgi:hypothetical protein
MKSIDDIVLGARPSCVIRVSIEFCRGLWDYEVDEVSDSGRWAWLERRLSSKSIKNTVTETNRTERSSELNFGLGKSFYFSPNCIRLQEQRKEGFLE